MFMYIHLNKLSSKSLDLPLARLWGKNKALPWDNLPGTPTAPFWMLARIDRKDGLILVVMITRLSLK